MDRSGLPIAGLAVFVAAMLGIPVDGVARAVDGNPDAEEAALQSCPEFGTGFFRLPNSETCLKIGGQITVTGEANFGRKALYAETLYLAGNPFIIYDLLPSEALPLKADTETIISVTTASTTEYGPMVSFASIKGNSTEQETLGLEKAFMAIGGFTIGRRNSFFDFSTGLSFTGGYASNAITTLVAYGRDVGAGGRVTVALEDNKDRRVEDGVWALRGSHTLPDVVVAARYDNENWGGVQLSAAITHLSDDRVTNCCGVPGDSYGWAIAAGAECRTKIAGYFGRFIFGTAYADGALSYLGAFPFATDYIVDADATLARTKGYSLLASYEHVWGERLKSTVTVSGISTRTRTRELLWAPSSIMATAGVEFMPATGLTVGFEGNYYRDMATAQYFGVQGESSTADFSKIKAYARRTF